MEAHLVVEVQRRFHARLQLVESDRLEDVEVVGHLILNRARTVDDILKQIQT